MPKHKAKDFLNSTQTKRDIEKMSAEIVSEWINFNFWSFECQDFKIQPNFQIERKKYLDGMVARLTINLKLKIKAELEKEEKKLLIQKK